MKTVEVLFLVSVFISTFAISDIYKLHFFILTFFLKILKSLKIDIINTINIFIHLQSMVQYCYCLYFFNSKTLVLFQYPFKNS